MRRPTEAQQVKFFVSGAGYRFGFLPSRRHLFGNRERRIYLLVTDSYGRDQLSMLLFGGPGVLSSQSCWVAGITHALLIGLSKSVAVAAISALERYLLIDEPRPSWRCPGLYLLFALRCIPAADVVRSRLSSLSLFLVLKKKKKIGTVGWARPARLVRGVVLQRQGTRLRCARSGLWSNHWILCSCRHILPGNLLLCF